MNDTSNVHGPNIVVNAFYLGLFLFLSTCVVTCGWAPAFAGVLR